MANGSNWSSRKNAYYRARRAAQNQQNQNQQQQPAAAGGGFSGLINAANQNKQNWNGNVQQGQRGGYNDENNQNLVKYQNQTEDKTADFLAGTERHVDLNNDPQYQDGYRYHNLPLNRLLARLGINKGPTVIDNQADFDAYCQQTGQTVMYRGWSGRDSAQRFLNTKNNHVGNGVMGDGYYFSPTMRTALRFAGSKSLGRGEIMQVALSPKANVISLSTLRKMMYQTNSKLQNALWKAGHGGTGRTFGSNSGEAQFALKMGYNVIDNGDYKLAITNDALVVCRKVL